MAKVLSNYCDLFDETLMLWEKYAEEYCSILGEYYDLLEQKRERSMRLNKIRDVSLQEFPVITFFCIHSVKEAEEYLLNLTENKLVCVNIQATNYVNSKLRADLKAKIHDYKTQIHLKGAKKSMYAMDPDACGCGRRCGVKKMYYNDAKYR